MRSPSRVGQQHLDDAGGVDQLAGGTRADGADTGDEDSHRNSGASSSRQPPLVGGTPPLPRKRAINPDEAGQAEDEQHAPEGLHSAGVYRAASAFDSARARGRRIATIDAFPGL